jgi:hypothetical protein
MDTGGNDVYPGKTSSQGAGHVGVLRDLGGSRDAYVAIRNSQGFALVDGLGVLQDDGGNDTYLPYMPRPKNPGAVFQTPGSGGVVDDNGLCDNLPRTMQRTALIGGAGVLMDQDGSDVYLGAPPATQPFKPPDPVLPLVAGLRLRRRARHAPRHRSRPGQLPRRAGEPQGRPRDHPAGDDLPPGGAGARGVLGRRPHVLGCARRYAAGRMAA